MVRVLQRAVVCACLLLCGFAAPATAAVTLPSGFEEVTVATGLGSATDAVYTPDGRIISIEKAGRVRVAQNGTSRVVLDLSNKVNAYSDRGMLGVDVDKEFAQNGWVYLLYVAESNPLNPDDDGPTVSKLTRITLNRDNTVANPSSPETVILGTSPDTACPTPDNDNDCIPADFYWHTIGTVRVDPVDGSLWVGTGDASFSSNIQETTFGTYDENTYRGKILHIGKDGRGLPGHPFCPADTNLEHACTKVYAKGFRNPFRFALRPGKGPVVADVGADRYEEVNLVRPGANYGWPCFEGTVEQPVYRTDSRCRAEYDKTGSARALEPDYQYPHADGASITGGPVYDDTDYPSSYRGDVFIADYVQGWVKRLDIDESGDRIIGEHPFATYTPLDSAPAFVDLIKMPNGNVGYVDLGWNATPFVGGLIREFRYTSGNRTPVPSATGGPLSGAAPLTVDFDAGGSSDPDGDALSYAWNFGDGTTGSGARPSHTYATPGTYTARVTVTDGRGGSASADVGPITPGNTPPTATIVAPADRAKFRYGSPITLEGSGADTQEGDVPGSRLTWTIRQQHGLGAGSHTHDFTSKTGSTVTLDPRDDHDADSYFSITLTATDAQGSSGSQTIRIDPETVDLTLASSPAGAPVQYASHAMTPAPSTVTAAIGHRPTIVAAESFVDDGTTYRFRRWADSATEPRQRVITVPGSATTFTAHYNGVPTAAFTATPASGAAPLDVAFDASPSIEPDAGDTLTYAWDFGDGSPAGSGRAPSHRYANPGNYTARLTVTDTHGATATHTRQIDATDSPPVASTDGDSRFRSGAAITVTGSASDAQDGPLGAERLAWKIFHHRGSNPRVLVGTAAGTTADYTPPTTTDTDSHYVFELTATDSFGNTSSATRRVDPQVVAVRVVSSPAGADPSFPSGNTTFPRASVVGFAATASTPATFTRNGTAYNFRRWSDGNTSRSRAYSVPNADPATLTAEYNGVPTAAFSATPASGPAPLDVTLDAGASSDPENGALTYTWDFGDGSPTATGRTVEHRYPSPGSFTARLTVADAHGATATTTEVITPGNSPPTPSTSGDTTFRSGSAITVNGSATDVQDGDLAADRLSWRVFRVTGPLRSQVDSIDGSATARFAPPSKAEVGSWYEFELTATDSAGASRSTTHRVDPRVVDVTVDSSPTGAAVTFPGANTTFPRPSVAGFSADATAPQTLVRQGVIYELRGWSDGATTATRPYTVPDADTSRLTALYNGLPTAAFTATPQAGGAPLVVAFDAGSSSDPEGHGLSYAWDFGDGTAAGSGQMVSHVYTTPGSYTARLTVTDSHGATAVASRVIVPGDSPPTATIDSPPTGERFDAGERITLAGRGWDAQGPATLEWRVLHLRGGTSAPVAIDAGGFTVRADPRIDDWYEVQLTARDSAGLTATSTRRIDPHTSNVRLVSDPQGVALGWNGSALTAPATALAVVGSRASVSAPVKVESDRGSWLFGSWSDGGEREHPITVAAGSPELRVSYTLQDPPLPPPQEPRQPSDRDPGGGSGTTPAPPPPQAPADELPALVDLRLPRSGLKSTRSGAIKISLHNRNKLAAIGSLELVTERGVRVGRARARRLALGEAAFIVAPGAKRTITVRLSKRGLAVVKKLRRVAVTVDWDARDRSGRDGSGRSSSVVVAGRPKKKRR